MRAVAEIIEMDEQRDRKTCVQLDLKVTGANKELAQWLLDHPRYTGAVVAGWLGCGERRIQRLRVWATEGFIGSHQSKANAQRPSSTTGSPLESQENLENEPSEDSELVESPEVIEDNALHSIQRSAAVATAYRKILKASSLDREAKARISEAIERLIAKWRQTQTTLTGKRKHHD